MAEASKNGKENIKKARESAMQQMKRLEELTILAEQGNVNAQLELAMSYDGGEGVAKDNEKALYWFKKAAEQGNSQAQYILGLMFYQGKVVPMDKIKAAYWLRKAADNGDTQAKWALSQMID